MASRASKRSKPSRAWASGVTASSQPCLSLIEPSGAVRVLPSQGFPLGIFPDTRFPQSESIALGSNSTLVLLTDGFFEAHDPIGNTWGTDAILAQVRDERQNPAQEIVDSLFDSLRKFCEPNKPRDDAAVVIVKIL